jgi:hypothetical protein
VSPEACIWLGFIGCYEAVIGSKVNKPETFYHLNVTLCFRTLHMSLRY